MMNLPPGVSFMPFAPPETNGPPAPQTIDGVHRFHHWAMACSWGLWIAQSQFDYAARLAQEFWDEIDRLEGELSRFISSSDIFHLNAAARNGDENWVHVGADAWDCLYLSLALSELSGGAFDIGLGSVMDARRARNGKIKAAKAAKKWPGPGSKYLQLAQSPLRARLSDSRVQIDLGAVGKGFALDRAARLLNDWGIRHALLSAGQSSVLALGDADAAASGAGWAVELRREQDKAKHQQATKMRRAILKNAALSGSGRALQGYHIIDPRDGKSARQWCAAWAVAPSAALSDACSTALMVMQREEIAAFCQTQPHVGALLADENGQWLHFGRDVWD